MNTYLVKQTLARQRTIMVEATSKAEAMTLAQDGYGEIIENEPRCGLLCQGAEKAEDDPCVHTWTKDVATGNLICTRCKLVKT